MSGFALGDSAVLSSIGPKGNYARFDAGAHDIRVLMSPGNEPQADTIYPVGVHYIPVGYKQNATSGDGFQTVRVLCPKFTYPYNVSAQEMEAYHRAHCPICNFVNNDILSLDKQTIDKLNRVRVRRNTAIQFLDLKDILQASGGGVGFGATMDPRSMLANCSGSHVKVWELGPELAVNIKTFIMDPVMRFLFDPDKGFFVHITVTGAGLQKKYTFTANTTQVFPVSMEWLRANVRPLSESYSPQVVAASQATADENLMRFKALHRLDGTGGVPGAAPSVLTPPSGVPAPTAAPAAPGVAPAPLFGAPSADVAAAPLFTPPAAAPAAPAPMPPAPAAVAAPAPASDPAHVMGTGSFGALLAEVEDEA